MASTVEFVIRRYEVQVRMDSVREQTIAEEFPTVTPSEFSTLLYTGVFPPDVLLVAFGGGHT